MPSAARSTRFAKVRRPHAADHVFDELAAAILRGRIRPGSPLPPERILSAEFGVSRLILRQALHRLAEIGLVAVRQGGATLACDPSEATDLRVIELLHRLGPRSLRDVRDATEVQLFQGHALLTLAGRRASAPERAALAATVEEYAARGGSEGDLAAFEESFWCAVARAGGNRLYVFQTTWWYRLLADRSGPRHPVFAPPDVRVAFYREVAHRLVAGLDAAGYYLERVVPVLELLTDFDQGGS